MREIYLLGGLGADKRVYDFVDFSGFKLNHVDWVDPAENESIESYAARLLDQIKADRPIIIGVSFGGMVAIEIAKQIETEKVIVISSAKTKFDSALFQNCWLLATKQIDTGNDLKDSKRFDLLVLWNKDK